MSSITVATADFRRALIAAGPHAAKDPEDSTCHRVRLAVGPENLTVAATNRYSAGLALVSVEEHDGELVNVDLSPENVKEILALFKSGRPGTDDEIGDTLQLATNDRDFKVTDTSGLFPGKSLSLPRYPSDDNFPDLQKVAHTALTTPGETGVERLFTSGSLIALFKSAATAYGTSLAIEMTGRNSTLAVSCGESFLGLLMPIKPGEDAEREADAWRTSWLIRLADLQHAA